MLVCWLPPTPHSPATRFSDGFGAFFPALLTLQGSCGTLVVFTFGGVVPSGQEVIQRGLPFIGVSFYLEEKGYLFIFSETSTWRFVIGSYRCFSSVGCCCLGHSVSCRSLQGSVSSAPLPKVTTDYTRQFSHSVAASLHIMGKPVSSSCWDSNTWA